MILIETSILIDAWRKRSNPKVELFRSLVDMGCEIGFSIYTCQEALQGARDEAELTRIRDFFSGYQIFYLDQSFAAYDCAAYIYYSLRRHGITIRSSIDTLIAATAILNDLPLLHNDRDFDAIAERFPTLRVFGGL